MFVDKYIYAFLQDEITTEKMTEMLNADKKHVVLNAASCVICVGVCVLCMHFFKVQKWSTVTGGIAIQAEK